MTAAPPAGGRFDLRVLALLGVLLAPWEPAAAAPRDADGGQEAPRTVAAGDLAGDPAVDSVVRILSPAADGEAPERDGMIAAIHGLGHPAIPVLVAVLAGEIEPPVVVPGSLDAPVHPLALAERAGVLEAALARFPVDAVLAHLAERLRAEPGMDLCLMLASMLGRIDDPRACELLVEAIEGVDPLLLRTRYVQQALEEALTSQLLREGPGLDLVWRSALDSPPERLEVYARALGATRTSRGIELLASWIDHRPEANHEILKQLGRVGGLAVSSEVLAAVRSQLRAADLEVRRSALIAAGMLRDETAFDELVSMLDGEPELVAASARWSLRTICAVDLGPDRQAWLDWREREVTWLAESAPLLIAELESAVPGVVLGAAAELAAHPFHRHAVADALGPLTEHADPQVARGVCVAIARLESGRSVPWLLAALRGADPELRAHAARSLQRLTGLDLPAEHQVWARALQAG